MKPTSLALVLLAALVWVGSASAHARISPDVSVAKQLQLYNLAVPTEKEGATTTKIELDVPSGFAVDSSQPTPGWKRQVVATGSGDNAVVHKVIWTGGRTPTEEDSVFGFNAAATKAQTYKFTVQQTYSDGSVVSWSGPESSDTPAPTIEAKSSFGGGGNSTLDVIALIVGGLALVLSIVALSARRGARSLT